MSTLHEKASAEAEKRWPTLTMLIGQQALQHFALQGAFLQGAQWGVEEAVNWINERGGAGMSDREHEEEIDHEKGSDDEESLDPMDEWDPLGGDAA